MITPLKQPQGIMVYCEISSSGVVSDVGREMLFIGKRLAQSSGEPLMAAIMGNHLSQGLEQLASLPLDQIFSCEDERLTSYSAATFAHVLSSMAMQALPRVLLLDASCRSRDLAARTAAKLRTGLTADCTALQMQEGLLLQTRPAFHGSVDATIVCEHAWPQMATVRPGIFPPLTPDNRPGVPAECIVCRPLLEDFGVTVLCSRRNPQRNQLSCADIIVSGGKGVRNLQGAEQLTRFAQALGAPVGATRAAVEAGLFPYSMQIGQTGKTVHAKLYIACGISGSSHHFAGVRADRILAINHDPDAPVFRRSDYGVCGNLGEILPALEDEILRNRYKFSS